jgi:dihydroorotate dehydrogenase (fumarate)
MGVDLTTQYLGLQLTCPLVVAACPLTADLTMLRRMEEAGAGAAVLPSVFQEQIERQDEDLYHTSSHSGQVESSASFVPDMADYNAGPDSYLQLIELAKKNVKMPVIASLNGTASGSWTRYAKSMGEAGADALEVNVSYVPTDPAISGQQIENRLVELVGNLREQTNLPLAVKIGPYYSALPSLAQQLVAQGANGLVLFNRFLEPEIDVETFTIRSHLQLSERFELRLPLRWIAILRDQLSISLAATSGVHTATDAVKAILAGADVTMMASALYRHGVDHLFKLYHDLGEWMQNHGFPSLAELRGKMSFARCRDAGALERANYLNFLASGPTFSPS